jgi:DNA-binding response OmpR family regulator
VLIVDDEQRYADMLSRRLTLRGLTCQVCYDGQTAIDLLAHEPFTLVILDLRLPDLYGTEVLAKIKHSHPPTEVVILTGHGTDQDREQCLEIGAYAFLNKPVDIDQLIPIISKIRENSACEHR